MTVSVLIPCFNGVADTRRCLAALQSQVDAPPLDLVVIDNGCTDETAALGDEFASVRVVASPHNLGFAGGVNLGLEVARGDLTLVINNDTQAAPRMVANLVRALETHPGVGAVAPQSNMVKGEARISVSGTEDADTRLAMELALIESFDGVVQDVDNLAGLCLLARTATLRSLGGFDTRFRIGNFEDDDLSLRMRLRGLRLLLARDAFLHHEGHRTFDAMGVDYREAYDEHRDAFLAKWRHDPAGEAAIAMSHGDRTRAARTAAAGLRRYPRWPDGHWALAKVAANEERHADCIDHLRPFLDACPKHTEAHAMLALCLVELGQAGAGHQHLAWTLSHCYLGDAAGADILTRLARIHIAKSDFDTAVAWLRSALDFAPDDPELHNLLGATLLDARRPGEALPTLQRATELGSVHGGTNTGICLWQLGRRVAALRAFREAAAANPDDEVTARNLAAAEAASG